jgi:hypothetical protein
MLNNSIKTQCDDTLNHVSQDLRQCFTFYTISIIKELLNLQMFQFGSEIYLGMQII